MILQSTLRRMAGEAMINETRGYLFPDGGEFGFAYRTPAGLVVDRILPKHRAWMWRWFDRIIGYRLSGKPAEEDYTHLDHSVPNPPLLENVPIPRDFEQLDRRVVVYGSTLAVFQDREMFYRSLDSDVDSDGIPNGVCECINMVKVFGSRGGPVVEEARLRPDRHGFMYVRADILLKRNGI